MLLILLLLITLIPAPHDADFDTDMPPFCSAPLFRRVFMSLHLLTFIFATCLFRRFILSAAADALFHCCYAIVACCLAENGAALRRVLPRASATKPREPASC